MTVREPMRALVIIAAMVSATASAQRQDQRGQEPARGRGAGAEFAGPPQGPNAVPIVQVVGCLSQSATNTWMLTNATDPSTSTAGFSRAEDVKAAEATPLGTREWPLIGLVELGPLEHKGHKVLVKGMLIKDANTSRLNVTSLMTAANTCTK